MIGTVQMRIIETHITVICADGAVFVDSSRLATSLIDAGRYPAALTDLYHQRWEHKSAYYALRHTITNGRVLRSGDRPGLEQEKCALLTLYRLLRTVMIDAAESRPGTDPDRCSFTVAFQTACGQVLQATRVTIEGVDPVGAIGHAILAALLSPRRPRVSTRKVKSPMSRYKERLLDGRPARR